MLIRTRSKSVWRTLLASAVAFAGLLPGPGCTDNKSDGQIKAAPEASDAAAAIAKSYSENMLKKHADQAKKRP
jgi:hypothetical protein